MTKEGKSYNEEAKRDEAANVMPRRVRQPCHERCHSVKLSDSTMNKVKWHVVSGIVAVMLVAIAIWSIKSFPRSKLLERAPAAERQRIEKKLETAFKELDVESRK